jgi:transient receptor potential cation channel subfamily M protein 3
VRPGITDEYWFTLVDIGLAINKLMGGAFRSSYCRRKFRHMYAQAMKATMGKDSRRASENLIKSRTRMVRKASVAFFNSVHSNQNQQHPTIGDEQDGSKFFHDPVFEYPFHDLMVSRLFSVISSYHFLTAFFLHTITFSALAHLI